MNISITNKDGLVLETAHEICEENIIIEPVLQDINITRNGKYLPGDGYAGFRRAFIEIPDSAIPTEVATEEEMTAILSSGDVGGVYKYVGETGEVYANGEMYVLEALPDELAGTWVFNALNYNSFVNLGIATNQTITFTLNYIAMGEECTLLKIDNSTAEGKVDFIVKYFNNSTRLGGFAILEDGEEEWGDDGTKTITITSHLADVENGDTLLAWLQANATKQ